MNDNFILSNNKQQTSFQRTLGFSILASLISSAPYDTGNLAHSIKMPYNTPRKIKILYPIRDVSYLGRLEHDINSVHYGFIANDGVQITKSLVVSFFENPLAFSSWLSFNKRKHLSSEARKKGFGKSRVSVGHSRYNSATRATRRLRSNAIYDLGRNK